MSTRIIAPVAEYLEGLAPDEAIPVLRGLLTRLPDISNAEWAAAVGADAVVQMLGLQSRPTP